MCRCPRVDLKFINSPCNCSLVPIRRKPSIIAQPRRRKSRCFHLKTNPKPPIPDYAPATQVSPQVSNCGASCSAQNNYKPAQLGSPSFDQGGPDGRAASLLSRSGKIAVTQTSSVCAGCSIISCHIFGCVLRLHSYLHGQT